MRKARTIWLLLAFFLVSLLAAMAWITKTLLEVERDEEEIHRRAALEQNVRLALWRMDARVNSLLSNLENPPSWARQANNPILKAGFYYNPEDETVTVRPEGVDGPEPDFLNELLSRPLFPPASGQDDDEQTDRNNLEVLARTALQNTSNARAAWMDDDLVVARPSTNGRIIGWVLDWDRLRALLLVEIRSLLNRAELAPVDTASASDRRLATLPVVLKPGAEPTFFYARATSPAKLMLLVAWSCMLLPAIGLGVLLIAAYSLNERRDAFVSAVTHELRTPLTTFSMYTEMLESGMVDERKYSDYFATLRREAIRLNHLVENVLTYARIERGKTSENREVVQLSDMISRIRGQLEARAERADMAISITVEDDAALYLNPASLERIIVNLVDNACKYGCGEKKQVDLRAGADRNTVCIRVRDYGPGIAEGMRKKLFTPFSKTDREAAVSAPGVGLGLALSRRLARQMGGELELDTEVSDGAAFRLRLPRHNDS